MREITRIHRQKFVNKVFKLLEDTGMSHTDARHYVSQETGIRIEGVARWATGRVVPREPALGKLHNLSRSLTRNAKEARSKTPDPIKHPVVSLKSALETFRSDPNGTVHVSEASQEVTMLSGIYQIAMVSLSKSDRLALANMLMAEYLSGEV